MIPDGRDVRASVAFLVCLLVMTGLIFLGAYVGLGWLS